MRGKLSIDGYPNTGDVAYYGGHFYSDKAPGTVALALPAFAAVTVCLQMAGTSNETSGGWLISSWVSCLFSITIVSALGAGALFNWLRFRVTEESALITTLAIYFGAAPLPYSTMMFSHSIVVSLIAIALWAGEKQERAITKVSTSGLGDRVEIKPCLRVYDWVAGIALGMAVASEYTSGIIVVCVIWRLSYKRWERLLPLGLAAAIPLCLIPSYSWVCFGTPFLLPYSVNPTYPEMRQGLFAIKWPNMMTGLKLLFSLSRGLFVWSPFMILAVFGYLRTIRQSKQLVWLWLGVPLLQILIISGRTWDWTAGPTLGPRYLAPILPLVAIPCSLAVERWRIFGLSLASLSIVITTLATLICAAPPDNIANPILDFYVPLLKNQELAPNLGIMLGLPPYVSLIAFYAVFIFGVAELWVLCRGEKTMKLLRRQKR
jgi:hypothetical protein